MHTSITRTVLLEDSFLCLSIDKLIWEKSWVLSIYYCVGFPIFLHLATNPLLLPSLPYQLQGLHQQYWASHQKQRWNSAGKFKGTHGRNVLMKQVMRQQQRTCRKADGSCHLSDLRKKMDSPTWDNEHNPIWSRQACWCGQEKGEGIGTHCFAALSAAQGKSGSIGVAALERMWQRWSCSEETPRSFLPPAYMDKY